MNKKERLSNLNTKLKDPKDWVINYTELLWACSELEKAWAALHSIQGLSVINEIQNYKARLMCGEIARKALEE